MVAGSTAEGRALRAAISECCQSGKVKTESGKVKASNKRSFFEISHCVVFISLPPSGTLSSQEGEFFVLLLKPYSLFKKRESCGVLP